MRGLEVTELSLAVLDGCRLVAGGLAVSTAAKTPVFQYLLFVREWKPNAAVFVDLSPGDDVMHTEWSE
eukprot:154730-Prymnesium_polylepis.1